MDTIISQGANEKIEQEAELAILGAISIRPEAIETIAGLLKPDHFGREDCRIVYEAALSLCSRGASVDSVSLMHELGTQLDFIGGPVFIAGLSDNAPITKNLNYLADIIKQGSARRNLLSMVGRVQAAIRCGEDPSEISAALRRDLEQSDPIDGSDKPPAVSELAISTKELNHARLTPKCIVRDYLFADVATLSAPGGTGKTTLVLYELVCISLARPVHGLDVLSPGWCLLATAEDRREQLIARLREICKAMNLTDDEMALIMSRVLFWDVSGRMVKLITSNQGGITLTSLADDIVRRYRKSPPVLVVFDPVVSFGVSEAMVNDNEQAIITACRRIVRGLDCCVRLVAHTGKASAREATLDQYSSRGGSALSDGARMVAVLQAWKPGNGLRLPPGLHLSDGSSVTILARPKLSYAPPNPPLLWIIREGYRFEAFTDFQASQEDRETAIKDQVLSFLAAEVKRGVRHNKTSLESSVPNQTRSDARKAINHLMAEGRIVENYLPPEESKTKRKTYLDVSAGFGRIPKHEENDSADKTTGNPAAAYRENFGGRISPPNFPPFLDSAANGRQDSAGFAELSGNLDNSRFADVTHNHNGE